MDPKIYEEYEKICKEKCRNKKNVLEIGSIPGEKSLLNMEVLKNKYKVGINLKSFKTYDFNLLKSNANNLGIKDQTFDIVMCNAVLEHDKFFWKTISEIKRVTKSGGIIIIGVPGFVKKSESKSKIVRVLKSQMKKILPLDIIFHSTLTFKFHPSPGDYYRFSEDVIKEVFFSDLKKVQIKSISIPPRLLGYGIKP